MVYRSDGGTGVEVSLNGAPFIACTGALNTKAHDAFQLSNLVATGFDGYLSECYLVDGQALEPTAFGYDYENQGKWAPLDNAVIKQNIEDAKAFNGPEYDNSQVWSEGTTGTNVTLTTIPNLFDGNLSTGAEMIALGSESVISGLSIDPVSSTLSVYSPDNNISFGINGGTKTTSTAAGWHDVSFTGTVESIEWENPDPRRLFIYGLKADDALLVDPRNTSQMWSNFVTGSSSFYPGEGNGRLFDGNFDTWEAPPGTTGEHYEYDFSSLNLTYSKIELVVGETDPSSNVVEVNGVDISSVFAGTPYPPATGMKVDITSLVSGPLKSIKNTNGGTTQNRVIYAVILDDQILVDKGFGPNGFYLPFDPDAVGVNYSQYGTGPMAATSYLWSKVFNGIKTKDNAAMPGYGETITFALPAAQGTAFSLLINKQPDSDGTLIVNNVETPITVAADGEAVYEQQFAGSLSSFSLTRAANEPINNDAVRIVGVKIDGVLLVEYNNIGVDDSGNENHFHDQNFVRSVTASQVVRSGKTLVSILVRRYWLNDNRNRCKSV